MAQMLEYVVISLVAASSLFIALVERLSYDACR